MEKLWYKGVVYEDAKELVKENLANTVSAFIAAGYWLKCIRDSNGYVKDGYQSIWECAETEFGLRISEASRAMSMNDKYSVDGNSPFICDMYRHYNKSQLQEMLTMTDEQMELVTPSMAIKDIREIKSHEKQDPEMIQSKMEDNDAGKIKICDIAIEQTHSINAECESEVEEDFATEIEVVPEAEELIDIEFDTNELMQELNDVIDGEYREIPEEKSACGLKKTEYPEGSLTNTGGCGNKRHCFSCAHNCNIRQEARYCRYAPLGNPYGCTTMNVLENLKNEMKSRCQFINLDMSEHKAGNGEPDPCCKNCYELCEYRCQKSVLDKKEDIGESEQPALPQFKNNEQRKAWIEDVEAWGLWYEDENIQARYYKYDFPDGSRLIAVKYRYTCPPWMLEEECFKENQEADGCYRDINYHMIYSEEYRKNQDGQYGPYDRYYTNSTVSVSILVEYLKQQQKKEG